MHFGIRTGRAAMHSEAMNKCKVVPVLKNQAKKDVWGLEVWLHTFLTSSLLWR